MGAGASAGVSAAIQASSDEELMELVKSLHEPCRSKIEKALSDMISDEQALSCYCGECTVTVKGEPAAQCLCHCQDCRKYGGVFAQAAKLYPAENVKYTGKTICKEPGMSWRHSCAKCGGYVVDDKTGTFKMIMVPAGLFDTPFTPSMHIHYKEAICPMKDGLPKFAGAPASFGGSDDLFDEAGPEWKASEGTDTGQCYCGACKVTVKGEPAAQLFCHCSDCRKWGGGTAQAAKLYPADKVSIEGEVTSKDPELVAGKTSWRKFCPKCGGVVYDDKTNVNGMIMVPAGLFDQPFKPTMHIHYREKISSIKDGLPKFPTMPKAFGGPSDEQIPE